MKFLLLGALLCLAVMWHVRGLPTVCYSCLKFTNITECNQQPLQNCTKNETYCKIIQEKTGIPALEMFSKVTITKGCATAEECSGEVGIWLPKIHIRCCRNDLCNTFENIDKEENDQSYAEKKTPLPVIYVLAMVIYLLQCV